MKRKDVCRILKVSPSTVDRWRSEGKLTAQTSHNGHYIYNEDEVYDILNKHKPRLSIIYSRVSTHKQKADIANQINYIEQFCAASGITIDKSFSDIGSGIDFLKRKNFMKLLDLVEQNKVKQVIVTHKDRLSRVGFDMFKSLFEKHGCKIIVMSDATNEKTDEQEIFEEIISLLQCFSMKMYSKRRRSIRKALRQSGDNVETTTRKQRRVNHD